MVQYFPEGGGVNADELRALTRRPRDIYFNWWANNGHLCCRNKMVHLHCAARHAVTPSLLTSMNCLGHCWRTCDLIWSGPGMRSVSAVIAERRSGVVNIPASYSRGPCLKYRPEDRLSLGFRGFCNSLQTSGLFLKLRHDRFRPHPFQFISRLTRLY